MVNMFMRRNTFPAFSEYDGHSIIENQRSKIISEIHSQSNDYLLNVNKEEYIDYLVSKYSIPPVEIYHDNLHVSTYEALIPAEMHPRSYHVMPGKSYAKDIIKYHLPFKGDPQLLKFRSHKQVSIFFLYKLPTVLSDLKTLILSKFNNKAFDNFS